MTTLWSCKTASLLKLYTKNIQSWWSTKQQFIGKELRVKKKFCFILATQLKVQKYFKIKWFLRILTKSQHFQNSHICEYFYACCSVAKLCPTLCDPMDCSMPGSFLCPSLSPRVCTGSHPWGQWWYPTISPLLPPSPFAFNLSQDQGLFQWVGSLMLINWEFFQPQTKTLLLNKFNFKIGFSFKMFWYR